MADQIQLQECSSTASADCYTQTYFTFHGKEVEIQGRRDSDVSGVWIDPDAWGGDLYAGESGYGVTYTRSVTHEAQGQEGLAITGAELGLLLALGLVGVLLILVGIWRGRNYA